MFHTNPTTITKWRLDWDTLTGVSQKFAVVLSSSVITEDNFPMQMKATKEKKKKKRKIILNLPALPMQHLREFRQN